MAHRVPITVRLDHFEGPLDLLLYLIQTHELDINKISITKITDQYLGYVRLMQELNFDIASEFLLMAATLIHWKSKSLLPQENAAGAVQNAEDDIMSQEDLIRQLLEHQRFLEMGQDIAGLPTLGIDIFTRPNRRPPTEKVWKEMSVSDLTLCFQDILVRARKRTQILKKETVSISQKIYEFSTKLKLGKPVDFMDLISIAGSRPETVVTFLATLELSRLKKTKLYQQEVYSQIYVELIESLMGFDPTLAIGFDTPIAEAEKRAEQHTVTQTDELTGRLVEFMPNHVPVKDGDPSSQSTGANRIESGRNVGESSDPFGDSARASDDSSNDDHRDTDNFSDGNSTHLSTHSDIGSRDSGDSSANSSEININKMETDQLHNDAGEAYAAFQGTQHSLAGELDGDSDAQKSARLSRSQTQDDAARNENHDGGRNEK